MLRTNKYEHLIMCFKDQQENLSKLAFADEDYQYIKEYRNMNKHFGFIILDYNFLN